MGIGASLLLHWEKFRTSRTRARTRRQLLGEPPHSYSTSAANPRQLAQLGSTPQHGVPGRLMPAFRADTPTHVDAGRIAPRSLLAALLTNRSGLTPTVGGIPSRARFGVATAPDSRA